MRKHFMILIISVLIFGLTSRSGICAQEPIKIGVIDIKRVINTSKYGLEVMDQLQKKYEELQAKLEAKGKEVEALRDEIEKKSHLWSQEMRERKQAEYQRKLRELRTLQEDAQFEMQEYERKLLDPVFKELEIVIRNFVEREKFDLVMEKTQPGIYFASARIDISDKIVELFDKHYEELKAKRALETPKTRDTQREPQRQVTPVQQRR